MSTRLNKSFRERIAKTILQHRFQKQFDDLIGLRKILADEVYNDTYDPAMQRRMQEMPSGWFANEPHLQVHIGTGWRYVEFNGGWSHYSIPPAYEMLKHPATESRLVAYMHKGSSIKKEFSVRDPIGQLAERSDNAQAELAAQLATAGAKVKAALKDWYTVEALEKAWPDIGDFLKPFKVTPTHNPRQLPVIQTAELNSLLDLPPE